MAEGRCAQEDAFARLLLYRLRMADAAQLRALYDMPEGLEHRILRAAQDAGTYEELIARVKSKRYTRARIARIFAHALVGFTRETADALPVPPYARVLGLRLEAKPLLRAVREHAPFPWCIAPRHLSARATHRLRWTCARPTCAVCAVPQTMRAAAGWTCARRPSCCAHDVPGARIRCS